MNTDASRDEDYSPDLHSPRIAREGVFRVAYRSPNLALQAPQKRLAGNVRAQTISYLDYTKSAYCSGVLLMFSRRYQTPLNFTEILNGATHGIDFHRQHADRYQEQRRGSI
jgi:hypothetical protein